MSGGKERGWELVQMKAFTSWLNGYLEKRNLSISDIRSDLSDGVKLINFLELLSGKKISQKYDSKPPSRIQKIQNLHLALTFLEKDVGVKNSSGASAEDFADRNLKMILGFFWSLFKRYRIQTIKHEDKSSEEGLLLWCKKTTSGYRDVSIESYKYSFRDGMAFLALCDKYLDGKKEVLDYEKFQKENSVSNLSFAFEVAEKHLGVPKLLDAEEVSEGSNVDERSMVLYISLYFHAFTAREQQRGLLAEKDRIQQAMQGLQGTLEERAQLAERLDAENRQLKAELAEQREEMDRVQKASEDTANDLRARLKAAEDALAASEDQLARERDQQARIQMAGLGVLQQHLQTHVEDLRRWQKVLDLDQISEIDFSGEIRPQIAAEIAGAPFEKQLQALTERLEKENALLGDFLKQKEAEKKRAKQKEMDKKNRQESRK